MQRTGVKPHVATVKGLQNSIKGKLKYAWSPVGSYNPG